MKPTDKVWKPFILNTLFNIRMGNGFDKSKMTNNQPEVNFVSRISYNNGADCIVDKVDGVEPFEAGLITVPLGGCYLGSSFIQTKPFYTSQNVAVLYPIYDMSFLVKLFISKTIRIECEYKYQAFCRELNAYLNRNFSVMLPVDISGNPDWDWIEQYMKSLEEGLDDQMNNIMETADGDKNIIKFFADKVEIDDFKVWLQDKANLDADNQMSLDDVKFKEFRISDIFHVVLSKGDIKLSKIESGSVRLISSGKETNGLVGFIDKDGDGKAEVFEANCLTVDMFDNAFYQPASFYAVSHGRVNILLPKFHLTPNIGLFISTLVSKEQYKYDYGRAVYSNVIADMIIKLPVNPNGNPDWEWIEQYMKSLPYSDKEVKV